MRFEIGSQRFYAPGPVDDVIDGHSLRDETGAREIFFATIQASDLHAAARHGERIEAFMASDIETFEALFAFAEISRERGFHHAQARVENFRYRWRHQRSGAEAAAKFEGIKPRSQLLDSTLNLLRRQAILQSQPSGQYVTFSVNGLVFTFHSVCRISNSGWRATNSRAAAAG